ncbi:hypothetical protein H4R18_001527 [Coemansia javaensis]|uniref:PAS domain-containing protein n=1 Tax=Coemansia javaensis TaxID=2761396 RepID=A0A9W8HFF3_9FUNG|nr:hypothetical protein H4R18_001527 [Coemansia javaensis]
MPPAGKSARADAATTPGQQLSYIGIHARDETTQVLYTSSGCYEAIGYTADFLMQCRAKDFFADHFDSDDYLRLIQRQEDEDDDMASAYVFYVNIKHADGRPMLHRATTFTCEGCIVYIGVCFPEAPFRGRHELTVQMLDGAMQQRNLTRERKQLERRRRQQQQQQQQQQQRAGGSGLPMGARSPQLYYSSSKQPKAAFVLETRGLSEEQILGPGGKRAGPVVVFVTGSISRLIDADTSDVTREPFLKLVAPEDVLRTSMFLDRLAASTDVLFESFSLLYRPHMIDGDVIVADEDNQRVVVECLGSASQDGMMLLMRAVRRVPAPRRDTAGNYICPRVHEAGEDSGYISLAELISSDPETSDAPGWSQFN